MTRRKRILLDVDGPLTPDFFEAFCRELRANGIDATTEKITQWDIANSFSITPELERAVYTKLRRPGTASWFRPADGAVEFVASLRAWADVYAVTAPLDGSATWGFEREEWLIDQLGFKRSEIVLARDKRVVAGDAFVDDKLAHLVEWSAEYPSGLAVMWSDTYNVKEPWNGPRARGYEELRTYLEALRTL